jgi:hypothetical protein
MRLIETLRSFAAAGVVVILGFGATAHAQCTGDCNNDRQVTVDEIITGVVIALGTGSVDGCPAFDSNADGEVTVDEIVTAVNNALSGCPADCGDCNDGDACTTDLCDAGQCVHDPVVCADDGEECTAEICDSVSGCGSVSVEDGTSCDGGAGACQAGACVPAGVVTYEQDFELLDAEGPTALADDGWVVFGNVFDAATGRYLYGYGSFPAPNGGEGFSAIVSGQGGAEQGEQQLSIYNDYNNQDHGNGRLIESNVFRERRITADDVGTTLTFSFDAKRGSINDPADPLCPCTSTAAAFIKTLNPAAGFATTNFIKQETTAIPQTWDRYTLTLPIGSGLLNQLLQVGFTSAATQFQPSAVQYDNVVISKSPTLP